MRIGVALIIIADLLIRGSDLTAHYTNDGVWPARLIETFGWKTGFWSLHTLSDSFGWEFLLFSLHFIFALFLLFGYRTRLATFLVWIFYISLHNRNLFINQAGDDLLRLVLFWGLFLPWHACFSVDSKKIKHAKERPLANIGYLLLIASVYFFTVCLKTSPEWRSENSAIYYALSLEQLRLPFVGDWLYHQEGLMRFLTVFVFYIEAIIPLLILIPAKKGYLRFAAFLLIVILHTGIGSTLYVGLFFVINMVSGIGLLPPYIMDKLEQKSRIINFLSNSALLKVETPKRKFNLNWLVNGICILVIALSAIINLSAVKWFSYELRDEMLIPVNAARMDQYWGMFSPSVLKRDGWYVYYGLDSIGRQWDLLRNEDYVNFEKPKSVIKIHSTDRWRKLTENMQRNDMTFLRPLFCKYHIKKWNREHPEKKLAALKLYYMKMETLPDYKEPEVEKVLYCICDGN